ncbi:MAG TPA: flagellar hook-associated family protein [Methylocella sp.]|nr:flagellar hook-associated family protein [Methylocella sp.]
MIYPISTQSFTSATQQSVSQIQAELADYETEMSTGTYANLGLTLGPSSGEDLSLQSQASVLQTLTTTNQTASTRLSTTQSILQTLQSSAQDLLNDLLEGNSNNSNAATIQLQGQNDLQGLITSLNSSLGGDYIFAGINTAVAPITDYYSAGAANKAAVDNAFTAAFGMSQTDPNVSSISGASMQNFLDTQFPSLFQGSNWSTNWSSATNQTLTNQISQAETITTSVTANNPVFQQLAQAYTMAADLGTQNLGASAYQALSSTAQKLLSSAISNLINLQASVGMAQTDITGANNQMSLQTDILSTQIGSLENINTYDVATRITDLQTQIETSYSLTAQLSQLSLVKFL